MATPVVSKHKKLAPKPVQASSSEEEEEEEIIIVKSSKKKKPKKKVKKIIIEDSDSDSSTSGSDDGRGKQMPNRVTVQRQTPHQTIQRQPNYFF